MLYKNRLAQNISDYFNRDIIYYYYNYKGKEVGIKISDTEVLEKDLIDIAKNNHKGRRINVKSMIYSPRTLTDIESHYLNEDIVYSANLITVYEDQEVGWQCTDDSPLPCICQIFFGNTDSVIIDHLEKSRGVFHTHGSGYAIPSDMDIYAVILEVTDYPSHTQYIAGSHNLLVKYRFLDGIAEETERMYDLLAKGKYNKLIDHMYLAGIEAEFYTIGMSHRQELTRFNM